MLVVAFSAMQLAVEQVRISMKNTVSINEALFKGLETITGALNEAHPPYPLGFDDLDVMVRIEAPAIIAVGGPAGVGKSALFGALALNLAKLGIPVLYINPRLSPSNFARRLMAAETQLPKDVMDRGHLNEDQLRQVMEAAAEINELPIHHNAQLKITLPDLLECLQEFHVEHPGGVVFIDDLQSLHLSRTSQSLERHHELCEALKDIQEQVFLQNQVLFVGSESTRHTENKAVKDVALSDIRNAGNLVEMAQMVWLLYRSKHLKDPQGRDVLIINILKSTFGSPTIIPLAHHPEEFRFENTRLLE